QQCRHLGRGQFRLVRQHLGRRQDRAPGTRRCRRLRRQRRRHPRRHARGGVAPPARAPPGVARAQRHATGAGDPGAVMPARRFAAACLLALLACAAPARALELQLASEGLHDEEATQALAVMDGVARALPRRWSDALGAVRVEWRGDLPAEVHGRTRGNRILLRRALLEDADGRAARAALVHELAHVYDRSAAGGLSRDPRLLELAGWQDAPLRPWRTRNRFTDRSPDLYELESPAEFVAVNLEYY